MKDENGRGVARLSSDQIECLKTLNNGYKQ